MQIKDGKVRLPDEKTPVKAYSTRLKITSNRLDAPPANLPSAVYPVTGVVRAGDAQHEGQTKAKASYGSTPVAVTLHHTLRRETLGQTPTRNAMSLGSRLILPSYVQPHFCGFGTRRMHLERMHLETYRGKRNFACMRFCQQGQRSPPP